MNHVAPGPIGPNDPYRGSPTGRGFGALRSTVRWIYAALAGLSTVGLSAGVGLCIAAVVTADPSGPDEGLIVAGALTVALTVFLIYAQIFMGVYWLYKAWQWLPPEQRYAQHWRSWITPNQAALYLLIPYFHYYWMFVVNCGLCDALDRMRDKHPTREPAPKSLAIAAGICQVFVPLPVGAIVWLIYMSKVERLTREMSATTLSGMAHAV